MNIGLYFGSFNPIHVGHLIIASCAAEHPDLDRVWLVVTPQNPHKPEAALLNEYDRLHLVRLGIDDDTRLRASDAEFSLPRPSYTIDTLTYLSEKYPEHAFKIIMGSDSLQNLPRWKNAKLILEQFSIFVYERPGFPVVTYPGANITVFDAPILNISATAVRDLIKTGHSIRYLVPEQVREEIERSRHYR
ncbi:MAG: nicotinate-nucleotide adenylyltransferase [Chitinophagia bacterium]|nr:nicotinate-nucleotide adenylyltransferase [Chitinophagia bacterium]